VDFSESVIWVLIGILIVIIELPCGVLQLWLYDWYLDPWLEAREESKRKKLEKEKERKAGKEAQSQLSEKAQFNLEEDSWILD
jgi:flagellar basal body-associated protein FliL